MSERSLVLLIVRSHVLGGLLLALRAGTVASLLAETALLALRAERAAHLDANAATLFLDVVLFAFSFLFLVLLAELRDPGFGYQTSNQAHDPNGDA
jgi:hypothetical protein